MEQLGQNAIQMENVHVRTMSMEINVINVKKNGMAFLHVALVKILILIYFTFKGHL